MKPEQSVFEKTTPTSKIVLDVIQLAEKLGIDPSKLPKELWSSAGKESV